MNPSSVVFPEERLGEKRDACCKQFNGSSCHIVNNESSHRPCGEVLVLRRALPEYLYLSATRHLEDP